MNPLTIDTFNNFHSQIFQIIYTVILGYFGVTFASYLRAKRDKDKTAIKSTIMNLWSSGALIFIISSFYWMSFLDLKYDLINWGFAIVFLVNLLVIFIEKTPWWRFNPHRIDKYY
ncbi:MAG: hypothetical protein ACREBJ_05335 [Nitrosotalea sp.]